jgi:HEAT repeat protein
VLAADKLALISEVRDLLRLNDDAQALLLHSALQVGHDVEYWLNRIPEPTRRVELLTQATQNKLTIVRQRAAETLGTQDVPQSVEPLLTLALHDPNMDVRDSARQSLAQLTTQHIAIVERLKDEVMLSAEAEKTTGSTRAAVLKTLTYLPLSGLPLNLRTEVLMMRIRLRVTWLIEIGTTTPQGRAVALTTALLMAVVGIAYIFAMNSYYVSLAAPDIRGTSTNITISQGLPWLPSMGLEQEWVDTGISEDQVKDAERSKVRDKELEGFWMDHDDGDYRKWGKQVAEVLKVEHAASMRWYLGEKEEALEMLIQEITNPQDSAPRVEALFALGQILVTHPERAEQQHIDQLIALLSHPDSNIASRAASSLGEVLAANPELAQLHINQLIALFSHPDSNIASGAASSLREVLAANPELAQAQHIEQLVALLQDSNIASMAVFSLGEVLAANPELAQPQNSKQLIEQLVALLSNPDPSISYSAVYSLATILAANPELAQQHIEQLIELLSDPDPSIASSAIFSLGGVLAGNPELAQQHLEQLIDLLSHPDSIISSSAVESLKEMLVSNPELAQLQHAKQLVEQLVDFLSNPNPNISPRVVADSLGVLLAANPELAQQHVDQLVDLVDNANQDIKSSALSILGKVLAANPELAQLHIEQLLALLPKPGSNSMESDMLGEILAANPKLAQQYIDQLVEMLSDPSISFEAVLILRKVLAANPELAQPQYIEKLVDLLSEQYIDEGLAPVVGNIVANNSLYASQEVIQSLQKQLENSGTHSNAVLVLAHAYIHREPPFLLEKLTDPRKTLERPVAARALFLITLREPSRDTNIRKELQKLSNSPEPMERIWANKTLAMLDLASQAHQAAELDDEQRKGVTDRLQNLCQWNDYKRRCITTHFFREENLNFFGEEFTWAAGEAHNWMEKKTNEENAE